MLDNTFEIIWLLGLVTGSVIRALYAKRPKKDDIRKDRKHAGESVLLIFVFLGMQVGPLVYVFSSWLDFADYHLPATLAAVAGGIGSGLFAAALGILWRAHVRLGRNFSPSTQILADHTLVTEGIYRFIRHPIYTAHFFWAVAQVFLLQNGIIGPAFLVTFFPFYSVRMPREEKMMLAAFGREYQDYMDRTGRLFPRVRFPRGR